MDHLLSNSSLYNIKLGKQKLKELKLMEHKGLFPCDELLLVFCDLYLVDIWVHHGMVYPVIYLGKSLGHNMDDNGWHLKLSNKAVKNYNRPTIHLQCISGIHFNPVFSRKKPQQLASLIVSKNVNGPGMEVKQT